MTIVDFLFYDLFPLLLSFVNRVFNTLGKSLKELVSDWIDFDLPDWSIFDTPLLLFMFGSGLTLFVAYTLIKWILDLVN